MTSKWRCCIATVIAGALYWESEVYAGMIDKTGMEPWEICGLCHNLNGISPMPKFPHLAGQKSNYIEKQLLDFNRGERSNDGGQMSAISSEVDPENIAIIAAYFAQLPPPAAVFLAEDSAIHSEYKIGKKLFEQGRPGLVACRSCHNPEHLSAPYLKAQQGNYISKQIYDFKEGRRGNISDGTVVHSLTELTANEIKALATYLQSTRRIAVNYVQ